MEGHVVSITIGNWQECGAETDEETGEVVQFIWCERAISAEVHEAMDLTVHDIEGMTAVTITNEGYFLELRFCEGTKMSHDLVEAFREKTQVRISDTNEHRHHLRLEQLKQDELALYRND